MLTFSLGHLLMLMSRGMKYFIHRMENLYMTKYKHASIKIKFLVTEYLNMQYEKQIIQNQN